MNKEEIRYAINGGFAFISILLGLILNTFIPLMNEKIQIIAIIISFLLIGIGICVFIWSWFKFNFVLNIKVLKEK